MAEYIEREALKESLKERYQGLWDIYNALKFDEEKAICAGQLNTFMEAILRVKEAPSADVVEVRHGRWIWTESGEEDYEQYWVCSCCGEKEYIEYNYCPNCGAKMDGKGEG